MKYTKDSHITNADEVKQFFHYGIVEKKVMSHPDDPIINCTEEEMQLYERLLDECFEICERENEDIYGIFIDEYMPIFNKEMEELVIKI